MPSAHGTQCGLEAPSRRTAMRSFITDPVTGGVAALIVTVATVIAMYVALFGGPFSRGSEGKTAGRLPPATSPGPSTDLPPRSQHRRATQRRRRRGTV